MAEVTWEKLELLVRRARDNMSQVDPRGTWFVLNALAEVLAEERMKDDK